VREMQATLLGQLGRFDEGAAIFRELLETYPGGADLHASAAHFFMRMGLDQEAKKLVELAVSRGVHSKQLDEAKRYLQLATRGPGWSRGASNDADNGAASRPDCGNTKRPRLQTIDGAAKAMTHLGSW